jgi:hypothetical protein
VFLSFDAAKRKTIYAKYARFPGLVLLALIALQRTVIFTADKLTGVHNDVSNHEVLEGWASVEVTSVYPGRAIGGDWNHRATDQHPATRVE